MSKQITKTVARALLTGLYFDGVAFNAPSPQEAKALSADTTASDFSLTWGGGVVVEQRLVRDDRSLAARIAAGDLTPHDAAKEYIRHQQREARQKSFTVYARFIGKYATRVAHMPKRHGEPAYIEFKGNQIALIWNAGELQTDF